MPKPKATNIVCDTCGLPWSSHKGTGESRPLKECVRLLKLECESLNRRLTAKPALPLTGGFRPLSFPNINASNAIN